ncbi:MAG: hypothetical protein JO129_01575 [Candidatus Dependentiae bacterium]|nr:hypothetical protein [Candidatus Dependentiae bacterium]
MNKKQFLITIFFFFDHTTIIYASHNQNQPNQDQPTRFDRICRYLSCCFIINDNSTSSSSSSSSSIHPTISNYTASNSTSTVIASIPKHRSSPESSRIYPNHNHSLHQSSIHLQTEPHHSYPHHPHRISSNINLTRLPSARYQPQYTEDNEVSISPANLVHSYNKPDRQPSFKQRIELIKQQSAIIRQSDIKQSDL